VPFGEQGFKALEAQQGQLKAQQEAEAREQEQMRKRQGTLAQTLFNLRNDPSADNLARAWQTLKQGGMGEGLEPTIAEMLLMTPEQRRAAANQYIQTTPGMAEYITGRRKEEAGIRETEAKTRKLNLEAAQVGRPQQFAPPEILRLIAARDALPEGDPARAELQTRIEALGKPSGVTIETPVPVVDPRTGQVTYATRQEALGKTPPQFMEGLTPRERQNREAKLPAAKAAVSAFDAKSDKLAAQIEELLEHPGLNQITGLIGGRIIGVTDAGRRAESLYKSIVAQGGFSELQAMRDASTTGGALGNVSNQEGQYLRDAFAVLQRTQSTEDLQRGLRDALNTLRSAKARTREAFEDTYAYREGAAPTVAPPSRGSVGAEAPTSAGRQAALPMPARKEDAVAGQVYQTARGPARWDGKQFIPVSE